MAITHGWVDELTLRCHVSVFAAVFCGSAKLLKSRTCLTANFTILTFVTQIRIHVFALMTVVAIFTTRFPRVSQLNAFLATGTESMRIFVAEIMTMRVYGVRAIEAIDQNPDVILRTSLCVSVWPIAVLRLDPGPYPDMVLGQPLPVNRRWHLIWLRLSFLDGMCVRFIIFIGIGRRRENGSVKTSA